MPNADEIMDWRQHHHGAEATDYDPDDHAAAVDAALGLHEPGEQKPVPVVADSATVSEQLRQFAQWLAPFRLTPGALRPVGVRTVALLWMAGAGPCRGLSQRAVADMVGVTRATISHACREIAKATGVRARGMRSDSSVATYAALSATRWHRRRLNDNQEAKTAATLKAEPEAARWLATLPRLRRRQLMVEAGRIITAADRRAALRQLAAERPRRHVDALRIVRSHAGGKGSLCPAEQGGLGVIR